MATTIGTVELLATIDTTQYKRGAKEIEQANSNIEKSTNQATGSSGMAGSFKAATGASTALLASIVGVATAAGVAASKFILWAGINRSLNIEDAQAKLRGLGHDAASVATIMDSALASVKGTAFGLDAAASAAASAVASGVKPGKDLTRVLKIVGDTATISGRQFNEAGAIINKVLASNRLSMEEVNQLQDAGLPIMQMLGKEYKKSAAAMRDMVSNGEVDSKRFLNAIEKNIGGAALASGNTTRGAWANMQAAMARVGEAIVKDIIPEVREAFNTITKWFDDNKETIVKTAGDISSGIAKAFKSIGRVVGLLPDGSAVFIFAGAITGALIPAFVALGAAIYTALAPLLPFIAAGAAVGAVGFLIYKNWLKVMEVLRPIIDAFNVYVKPILLEVANIVKTQLVAAWNDLTASLRILWVTIQPYVPAFIQIAKVVGVVLVAALVGLILVIGYAIAGLARLIGWAAQAAAGFINFSVGVTAWIGRAVSAVVQGIGTMINWFKDLPGRVKSMFLGANLWLYEAGKDILNGLIRGMKDMIKSVGNIAGDIAGTVKNKFKSALGINSPSKVFAEYGKNIAQGLANGVDKYSSVASNAISGMSTDIAVTGSTSLPMQELDKSVVQNNAQPVSISLDGIMARSTADLRDIAKELVGYIDQERAAQNKPLIMGGR